MSDRFSSRELSRYDDWKSRNPSDDGLVSPVLVGLARGDSLWSLRLGVQICQGWDGCTCGACERLREINRKGEESE